MKHLEDMTPKQRAGVYIAVAVVCLPAGALLYRFGGLRFAALVVAVVGIVGLAWALW